MFNIITFKFANWFDGSLLLFMSLQKVVNDHWIGCFSSSANHFSTFASCHRFIICPTRIKVRWVSFLYFGWIIAAGWISCFWGQWLGRHFILVIGFHSWSREWADLIFAFAPTVTFSVSCLPVNRPSYVRSDFAWDICIMVNSQFVFYKFLFLALLLHMCNALVKNHVLP